MCRIQFKSEEVCCFWAPSKSTWCMINPKKHHTVKPQGRGIPKIRALGWGNSRVQHEVSIDMNFNKCRSQGIGGGGFLHYSLGVGGFLHYSLGVGEKLCLLIISLPPLRSRCKIHLFSRRDTHGYMMPSKYTRKYLWVLYALVCVCTTWHEW